MIFQDNDFEVFVDPDGDGHNYGELELNVLNTTWDLRLPKPYKDGGTADDAWEIEGLKTATSCDGTINDPADTDRSWTVEIAVPLRSMSNLKAKASEHGQIPRDGEQWRINFSRVEWDVEIVERHHRLKKDSPSGTAVTLASDIRAARGLPPEAVRHGREGLVGPRPAGELGVHAVRGGTWVGDHQVLLAGEGEWLELRHVAQDRAAFAHGAVAAARFVASAGAGLWTLEDVLRAAR